jgi:hypothetical protein
VHKHFALVQNQIKMRSPRTTKFGRIAALANTVTSWTCQVLNAPCDHNKYAKSITGRPEKNIAFSVETPLRF